jgi:predicted secreted protein
MARRSFLVAAATALATGTLLPRRALATRADVAREVESLTGGAQPKSGKVRLDVPAVAEYGDTVPLTVEVDSPMTDTDYVEAIYIFAEENPLPGVITFNFPAPVSTTRPSSSSGSPSAAAPERAGASETWPKQIHACGCPRRPRRVRSSRSRP